MYSEQELNKSNHNLLYLTPDFILTAIPDYFSFENKDLNSYYWNLTWIIFKCNQFC